MLNIQVLRWRLNNLYHIVDKFGKDTIFKMNWAQEELFENFHYINLIPKARQLGISTFIDLLLLDAAIFNDNVSVGIIAHSLDDAAMIFKTKIKYPYDHLPDDIKNWRIATTDSAKQLSFNNGSSIRVGTSMRSGTLNYLHISEFGKICAKYPEKAEEIVSGSLNTVHPGNYIFIESTAEGRGGYFYDFTKIAENNMMSKKELGKLDFKLHFFPWWRHNEYELDEDAFVPKEVHDYCDLIEKKINRPLDLCQRKWYAKKKEQQKEFIYREYPSILDECFMVSNEGFYYAKQFALIRQQNRICRVNHDPSVTVDTFWDLGMNDITAIWFVQRANRELHLIEYFQAADEGLAFYIKELQKRTEYKYGSHWFPHDIKVRELGTGKSRLEVLKSMGLRNVKVLPMLPVEDGIEAVRNVLSKCWFDEMLCDKGIQALENYKKVWNDKLASYSSRPLHNWASHGSDAFRGLAIMEGKIGSHENMTQDQADKMFNLYAPSV